MQACAGDAVSDDVTNRPCRTGLCTRSANAADAVSDRVYKSLRPSAEVCAT